MSAALRLLRENNPQRNEIYIQLDEEEDDAAIAQALEQNPYVSCVRLRPARRNAPWDNLLRVLATRGNLEHIILSINGVPNVSVEWIRRILGAIQQNASVRVVECQWIHVTAQDLCSFMDNTDHVTELTLRFCTLSEGAQGARDIVAALQRNANIQTLKLLPINNSLDPILEGLVLNRSVKHLALSAGFLSGAAHNLLRDLMESTRSIQHLELMNTALGKNHSALLLRGSSTPVLSQISHSARAISDTKGRSVF